MSTERIKTFWDIERERTWRIYVLFSILILFYFVPIFVVAVFIKMLIHARQSMSGVTTDFPVFGIDTLVVVVIATCASGIHWYFSNKQVVSKVLRLLEARMPDKSDRYHQTFNNVVDEIGTAAGNIYIERYVIPTGAMNAFALADLYGRKVVGMTEGLLSRLKREELQAVVAHEVAHIVSNDCIETTVACSLFDIYSEALSQFNKAVTKTESIPSPFCEQEIRHNAVAVGMLYLPVVFLLFLTDVLGQLLEMFVSREREYRADASAVRLTRNPLSLAQALYKIGTHWRGAGADGEHLASIFIMNPRYSRLDENEDFWATLFSTHPPLIKRMNIVLHLAHTNMEQIKHYLKKEETLKTEVELSKLSATYYAEHGGEWKGPFTLLQLQAQDWLDSETHLRIVGTDMIVIAKDLPGLIDFFKTRDEPMYKIRRLCPDCREWLIPRSYEGLYVFQCAFCNGALVEGNKLPRIFVRKEKGFTERIQRLAHLLREGSRKQRPRFNIMLKVTHHRQCPKCGKDMVHKFFSYAYHVEIDTCQQCHVMWFDADELETLQCLIELEEQKS